MTQYMNTALTALGALAVCASASVASAAGKSLDAVPLAGERVRIDGLTKEWKGRMTRLSYALRGNANAARVEGMVGYDDKFVYVAVSAQDGTLVRTAGAGAAEDHASLLLSIPTSGGRFASYDVDLYPGDPGKIAGAVKMKGRAVVGAKLVEAPTKGGFTFEAQIPWSAFSAAKRTRVGLRAALRYTNASAPGSVSAIVATSPEKSGSRLPALPLESEQGLTASLLSKSGVPSSPKLAALGNVAGDGMLEYVAVYGTHLTIVGPRYRGGKQFYFSDVGAISKLELADFDGDGKEDILLVRRAGSGKKYREVLEVRKVGKDDTPYVAFSHETAIVTEDGRIENDVQVEKRGKLPAIVVSQGKASGFEADSYAEPRSSDMPPALLPWESVSSRTYQFKGDKFEQVDEKRGTPRQSPGTKSAKPSGPPPPPAPRPPSADELQDRLYALYRKERKVGKKPPRFDFVTDVAGDTQMERVLVHDKDIVVFGTGYRGGTSFAYITVGVADPKDILDVTARDLTGDGKAEVIVRGLLHAKASKELGGDVVDRYALFIYGVGDGGVTRVFAAETGRQLGESRILGSVAFVPGQQGTTLELRPGRAVGWTEQSYPFPADTTAAGGLEPLLLPWSGASARRYVWGGNAFTAP